MSGLGKTYLSDLLRRSGGWFHYSVDYRIGTRYLGEHIVDNFKRVAMRQPFLRELLLTDSIYIASNITFSNLKPLSTWLGKPGNPELGGLPFDEYLRRQALHRDAEIASLLDTVRFIDRAHDLYGYDNFVCELERLDLRGRRSERPRRSGPVGAGAARPARAHCGDRRRISTS